MSHPHTHSTAHTHTHQAKPESALSRDSPSQSNLSALLNLTGFQLSNQLGDVLSLLLNVYSLSLSGLLFHSWHSVSRMYSLSLQPNSDRHAMHARAHRYWQWGHLLFEVDTSQMITSNGSTWDNADKLTFFHTLRKLERLRDARVSH